MKMSFLCEMHPEHMALGWKPSHMPTFDAYGGMATAHDVMEHMPGDSGDISDEFLALGAGLYVRGEAGYYAMKGRSAHDPGEQVAPDLVTESTVRLITNGTRWRRWQGSAPRVDVHVGEWIERAILSARREIEECFHYSDKEHDKRARACLDDSRNWMRAGYRRAEKRYGAIGHHEACAMFMRIERAADEALRRATEGDRLVVSMNIKRRHVDVRHEEMYE